MKDKEKNLKLKELCETYKYSLIPITLKVEKKDKGAVNVVKLE